MYILIEAIPCNSRDEKNAKKRFYIQSLQCVNKTILGRSEKEYRIDNKEHYADLFKNYYETNRNSILEKKRNSRITCECGTSTTTSGMSKHKRTMKHLQFIGTEV